MSQNFLQVLHADVNRCSVPSIDCCLCGNEYMIIVDGSVTVAELEDYKCPFCRRQSEELPSQVRHSCPEIYSAFETYWEERCVKRG